MAKRMGLVIVWVMVACAVESEDPPSGDALASSGGKNSEEGPGEDSDEVSEDACALDECFNTCVVAEPGTSGECLQPAPGYVPWDCEMDLLCPKFTVDLAVDRACEDGGEVCESDSDCETRCEPQLDVPWDAARCALVAIRDGARGRISFDWFDPESRNYDVDIGGTLEVYIAGDGTVLLDRVTTAATTCVGATMPMKSRRAEVLAPDDEFWDECLFVNTDHDLYACLVGDQGTVGGPQPWLQGTCTPDEPACP